MEPNNTEVTGGKIGVINGLRGLAIAGVVWHHLFGSTINPSTYAVMIGPWRFFPAFLLTNGSQGVPLFFILSGFVLALPYMQGHRHMHSFADARAFYARRLRRLGPLYALCVLISATFVYPHNLLSGLPMMFSMVFSFHPDTFFPAYNWVLWSLAVEAAFSVVFPLMLVAVRRFGMWNVLLTVVLVCNLIRLWSGLVIWLKPLADGLPGRLDDFVCGMMAAWLLVHRRHSPPRLGFLLGVVLLLLELQLADACKAIVRDGLEVPLMTGVVLPLLYSMINIGFLLCIDGLLRGRHRLLTWLFENQLLQMVGLMSYSVYVWHGIMIAPLNAQIDTVHVVRYLIMVFLLSAVTYRFVEFGYITDFRKLLPSRRTVGH